MLPEPTNVPTLGVRIFQGHPMDLFLKISVLQAPFLLAGRFGRKNNPWKKSVAGKKII